MTRRYARKYDSRRYNKKPDEKKGLTIGHMGVIGLAGATTLAAFLRPGNTPNNYVAEQFKSTPAITRPTEYSSLVDMINENAKHVRPKDYKSYLESSLEKVLEQWYGTEWSMNGASRLPRKGSVGCDYFVIRALEGLGYNFDLKELGYDTIAQNPTSWLAAEKIVKAVSSNPREFWGMSYKNLRRYLNTQGDGFYVIGLDTHVGFLQKKGDRLDFIHSKGNKRKAETVLRERADNVDSLVHSNVYVIGKLFTPDKHGDFFQEKYKPVNVGGI